MIVPRALAPTAWLLALGILLGLVVAPALSEGLQRAVAESKQTGKPVLVLGLNPQCPHCEALKKRMAEEPAIQALVEQYVLTKATSLQDPDAIILMKNYPPKVAGTPILIGIAPNGAQLFNQSGAPEGEGLQKLLEEGLAKSAQLVPPRAVPGRDVAQQPVKGKPGKRVDQTEEATSDAEPAKSKPAKKESVKAKKLPSSANDQSANFLRMAKKFSDPEKVKKYALKAIEAAPDSPHAAAARELIESLD